MYFLKRSSWTFQTPDGYRIGSGPSGKPWVCAQADRDSTVAAAAKAPADRNERRLTRDEDLSVFKVKRGERRRL